VLRTALDGTIQQVLAAGRYQLTSVVPVELDGLRMRWALDTVLLAGQTLSLELTNANAIIDTVASAAPVPTPVGRTVGPEVALYQRLKTGVLRVEAGLGHGSGFLVDSAGLVLTNAHVVAGTGLAAVVLDASTHVAAQILYRDENVDLAVLRIAPRLARTRAVLPLRTEAPLVEAGERLIAIGYPLHQEQTMTSGIASSIREGAIISDVNINHGNSGGPLLNLAGEVVAVNAFGDFTNQGGPGVSGAIAISRAIPILDSARRAMAAFAEPGEQPLPAIPTLGFRLETLKALADTADPARYSPLWNISVDRFTVALATPPINYVHAKAYENEVGKDRKKREARAGVSQEERYSELRDFRDWAEYVGDERAPVVTLTVEPKLGETGGSIFRRLMIGLNSKQTVRYKGDLREAELYRNGERVAPIRGGTTPVKQFVDNVWVDLKDVANYGYYVYPAEVFAPDSAGAPPVVAVKLIDLKNPDTPSCRTLDKDAVVITWNDFAAYYADQEKPFILASKRAKGPKEIPLPAGCPTL
jgi:putative serine protease PepD